MKIILTGLFACFITLAQAQGLKETLTNAINNLQADDQFKHSIISMYVMETKSGKIVFDKNSETGMAPASCQKVITSVTAFDLLGKDFVFKTELVYDGEIKDKILNGSLYLLGSGDPTLGSWRWKQTSEESITNKITNAILAKDIHKITGGFFGDTQRWGSNIIPNGWVWEDIGNYYGAGSAALNWRENQYDLVLKSGAVSGAVVSIVAIKPPMQDVQLLNELRTAGKGSGDNAYIYLPPYSNKGYVRGTIPSGENNFVVSGSFPDPPKQLMNTLAKALKDKKIDCPKTTIYLASDEKQKLPSNLTTLLTMQSPTLDSINYWFLKKSINLYGEALVKTIAYKQLNIGNTDTGIAVIKDFWSKRGIEKPALNMLDGSGLAPANRVTTNALVTVMQYARNQSWFTSFYNALPEMNGIKMKDGYIGGVRSYTGYVKSKTGIEYTFSFIVNNFDGSAGAIREKMWKVLNLLK
ncbi:MAG: D-alanyl-D-alanine carboxypeptidase/D-alanyl-D-alanine-endopeptidase [Ferruginibacter sp.]